MAKRTRVDSVRRRWVDDDGGCLACALPVRPHMPAPYRLGDHVRGDTAQVLHRSKMAASEFTRVARFDRHGNCPNPAATGFDEDVGLEHKSVRAHRVRQLQRSARVVTLAALSIEHALAARRSKSPSRQIHWPSDGFVVDARDGEVARRSPCIRGRRSGRKQPWNIARRMLAVAIHRDHGIEAEIERFAKPGAQPFALALRSACRISVMGRSTIRSAVASVEPSSITMTFGHRASADSTTSRIALLR